MRYDNVVIPIDPGWASPFVCREGSAAAEIESLALAAQITRDGQARRVIDWPIDEPILDIATPRRDGFYRAPAPAARIGRLGGAHPWPDAVRRGLTEIGRCDGRAAQS